MSVYDCFPYFNEERLLLTRLAELSQIVDYFVLAEGTLTFSGKPKPLYFNKAKHDPRFKPYLDRIRHIIVDKWPDTNDPWEREKWQRETLRAGMYDAHMTDTIMVSDCDEIPRGEVVMRELGSDKIKALSGPLYCYWLNCASNYNGTFTRMARYDAFMQVESVDAFRRYPPDRIIQQGCHSFSWMGGASAFVQKLNATSHQEYNTKHFSDPDRYIRLISQGVDPFDRPDWKFHFVPFDERFPFYMRDNRDLFSDWIVEV